MIIVIVFTINLQNAMKLKVNIKNKRQEGEKNRKSQKEVGEKEISC
jgi:hypothetical protein